METERRVLTTTLKLRGPGGVSITAPQGHHFELTGASGPSIKARFWFAGGGELARFPVEHSFVSREAVEEVSITLEDHLKNGVSE